MNFYEEEWSDIDLLDLESGPMIRSWSHSRYENFRKCHFRAKLLYVDKIAEPRGPLKPSWNGEYPNERGNRIHEAADRYVRGGVELIPELSKFTDEFARLKDLRGEGKVTLESGWGFDKDWAITDDRSPDCRLRMRLDALVFPDPTWAVAVDYKTGRKSGNELKHAEQTQLYTVGVLLRYPNTRRVTTELWYTDEDDLTRVEYTREQGLRFFPIWNKRGKEILGETEFAPNPNKFSCMYCGYGPKGNGVCKVGV